MKDNSVPGLNTTPTIAYRPLIEVSSFLLPVSVFYFKRTLRHCGHVCPYVGMGSLGTGFHWDCILMGDGAKISPRVPSTCMQNPILSLPIIHIIPSHQMNVPIDNPSLVPAGY